MDVYGVQSEGELFASSFTMLQNRVSVSQKQLNGIVVQARAAFFDKMLILQRAGPPVPVHLQPSLEMVERQLASACYQQAYGIL
jgi:hypothetical protein